MRGKQWRCKCTIQEDCDRYHSRRREIHNEYYSWRYKGNLNGRLLLWLQDHTVSYLFIQYSYMNFYNSQSGNSKIIIYLNCPKLSIYKRCPERGVLRWWGVIPPSFYFLKKSHVRARQGITDKESKQVSKHTPIHYPTQHMSIGHTRKSERAFGQYVKASQLSFLYR